MRPIDEIKMEYEKNCAILGDKVYRQQVVMQAEILQQIEVLKNLQAEADRTYSDSAKIV